MPTYGQRSAESPGQRLPDLVWKIHLLHGAQTRRVQNAAITGDAPGTLSRLGTERIQELALNAGWDLEMLSLEIGELGEAGF